MRKAIYALILILLVFGGLSFVYISYSSVSISLENLGISNVEVKPNLKTLYDVLTGNLIGALLSVVNSIDLSAQLEISNPSFIPLHVPSIDYEIYMNGIYMGNGHIDDFSIPPQSSITKEITHRLYRNQIENFDDLALSIVNKNGYLDIRIKGYAHVIFLNIPFETTKRINVVEIVKEKIKQKLAGYTPAGSLGITDAYWVANGNRVYSVKPSTLVHAFITITGNPNYDGEVTVTVKQDNKGLPDTTVISRNYYVSLSSEQSRTVELTFTPEYHSYSRGYYIKVSWSGGSWTMESYYPPRLSVIKPTPIYTYTPTYTPTQTPTQVQGTGTLYVMDAYWIANGVKVTSIPENTVVTGYVIIQAVGGSYDGTVTLKVIHDNKGTPDTITKTQNFVVNLKSGETYDLTITFLPEYHWYSRGYFLKASWSDGSWTMPKSYPPRLSVTK